MCNLSRFCRAAPFGAFERDKAEIDFRPFFGKKTSYCTALTENP